MVARGVALLALEATPKAWDLAAGWLLIEEAGGFVSTFEPGQIFPLTLKTDYSKVSWTVLAAANQKLFQMGKNRIHYKE